MAHRRRPILTALWVLALAALILSLATFVLRDLGGREARLSFGDQIGVVTLEGTIVDTGKITSAIATFRKDERIKAIIVRINSGGGAVAPSQEVYREIRKTLPVKTVIAYLETVAASGGYYIAAAADKIVANPGTLTGSIGVIVEVVRLEDLLQKLGVGLETVKSGEFKDMGSPFRKPTEKDVELLQALIQDIHGQFVTAVAEGRRMPVDTVRNLADGRVFTGAMARDLGLVDILGNFEDCVDLAKRLADLEEEPELVYPEEEGFPWMELFLKNMALTLVRALRQQGMGIFYEWRGWLPPA